MREVLVARIIDSNTEARIVALATRLGLSGTDAPERVLQMALDALEAHAPPHHRKMPPAEIEAELLALEKLSAAGRRWREENPGEYDEENPPSASWQEELYDGSGLPK